MKRRKFLQVATVSGTGLAAGCGAGATDKWMPYVAPPEDMIPGIPTVYASTCRECPAGCGILVKTREGRPIKIEGNPLHPVNRGRLCGRGQVALQGLYDPDRVTQPMKKDGAGWKPITWEAAETEVAEALGAAATAGVDRVAYVSAAAGGPLDRYTDTWLTAFRSSRRVRYEAFAHEPLREANRLTFGVASVPTYDFAAAKYILSFGADFLETWISPTANAIGFAESHGYREGRMAKFVACTPRRGMTDFSADEWFAPRPGSEHLIALAMANEVFKIGRAKVTGGDADALRGFLARFDAATVANLTDVAPGDIQRLAREFTAETPSLAVGGGVANQHGAATQLEVAVDILNVVAGNVGHTVTFPAASVWDRVGSYRDMANLVTALNAGAVDVAIVHGTNPAFTMPAGAGFAAAFAKARLKVSFSSYLDETAELCDLLLPDHHSLESWDIYEPTAGVSGMVQPTIRPIHDTRQATDVLLNLAAKAGRNIAPAGVTTARAFVAHSVINLAETLQLGGIWTTPAPRAVRLTRDFARLDFAPATFAGPADGMLLMPCPSPLLYDGRGANKSLLQQTPDPATKIGWQTWVEVHPETAVGLGVETGDVVNVTAGSRTARAVVYVYPGARRQTVAMPIGRGHTAYGRYAKDFGSNPLALLDGVVDASGGLVFTQTKVTLSRTGETQRLATTEGSARQMGRGIARIASFADLAAGHGPEEHEPYTDAERQAVGDQAEMQAVHRDLGVYGTANPKWEMAIDLARCTGCSACVLACHTENNVPAVGEVELGKSREMSWIRLERYYEGDINHEQWSVAQIPMLCQQCANAPCEPVCPVYAAYHTPDGLNGQIYNRCVGTRYCANNCPYKVRYFNWWDYGTPSAPKFAFPGTLTLGLNPDVTVRSKGVMEKCTFCVQRIRFTQNDARVAGKVLLDGAITPACAQTCPSGAITFGDANDGASRVSRAKRDARGYHVFEQLNTKPGVTYLSRVIHATTGGEA
jgi:molybdopterin-containing oxidoreductase family iron-sulfur binding subunit